MLPSTFAYVLKWELTRNHLLFSLGSGIIDSMDSCQKAAFSVLVVSNLADIPSGSFYQSDLFGLSASVLSLASNMVATILIGCKAW